MGVMLEIGIYRSILVPRYQSEDPWNCRATRFALISINNNNNSEVVEMVSINAKHKERRHKTIG